MGRNYEGPAHLKRNLQPAINELETIGFLEPLPLGERFFKDGKDWKIRLIQKGRMVPALPVLAVDNEQAPPPLVAELTAREVSKTTADELVAKHPAEFLQLKIDVFDWLVERKDKRVAKSPAGYLVKSITDDYSAPKGFVSKAERQRRDAARQAADKQATEERRRKRDADANEKAEITKADAYWDALSAEEQKQHQAAADAESDPEAIALEHGSWKQFGQRLRRRDYIRKLLRERGELPGGDV